MQTRTIGVCSDHAGTELKTMVIDFLKLSEYDVKDYGVDPDAGKSVDYPDYAKLLAEEVASGKLDRGIAICGTGIGMSIAANKVPGIRAALVWDNFTAKMAGHHNDANILCLGSRAINHHRAVDMVRHWLASEFEGDRHLIRLNKIRDIEKQHLKS